MIRTSKEKKYFVNLISPYAGKWVTMSSDKMKVLGVSNRMATALRQAQEKGEPHPLLIKAPDSSTSAFVY